MRNDGGLEGAMHDRRGTWSPETTDIERNAFVTLLKSREAAAAWRALAGQRKGRWKVQTNPSDVLDDVIRSLLMASVHKTLPRMSEMARDRYDRLKEAAHLLARHFQEEVGFSPADVEYLRAEDAHSESAKCAVHVEYITGRIWSDEERELRVIEDLPRPGSQGRGAQARAFALCLSTFLKGRYERPFDDFVLAMATLFHPDEADMVDAETLAKHRSREAARRSMAAQKEALSIAAWSMADRGDVDPWLLPWPDQGADAASPAAGATAHRQVPSSPPGPCRVPSHEESSLA